MISSDEKEDGRNYKINMSKTSQTEARTTEEDALEIVSAIDGMVRVIIYLFMLRLIPMLMLLLIQIANTNTVTTM